jgi:hypothetical protein
MANIRFKRFAAACVALSGAQQPAMAQVLLHEISGMAWRDRVADGIRAPHEANLGVPSQTVELRDGVTDAVVRTTTTDGDGRYLFRFGSAQPSRSYRIQTPLLSSRFSGYSPRHAGNDPTIDSDIYPSGANSGRSDAFVVTIGTPVRHVDIGLIPRSIAIGDLVWFDRSDNGLQHELEPGLQGLLVEAWNPERAIRFSQSTSDVDGRYRIQVPGWGPYRLRFIAPTGTSFTERHAGDPNLDSDVIASGPDTGWTGIVDVALNTIVLGNIDAGYLVADQGADIAIDYAEPPGVVFPGFGTSWSLRVREVLNREVASVRVRAPVPAGIQGMSWTCQGAFGATCPPAGTNALDFTVPLRFDGELHIEFAGQVAPDAASIVIASAEVTVAAPQWDAFPQNNTAQLELRSDELFFNGFQ